MEQLNQTATVGHWVARYPQLSRIFESLQIDYCCGGDRSLEQACGQRQLDPQHVLSALQEAIQETASPDFDNWLEAPLSELCDHIERTHHDYLRHELPRLANLIDKVVRAHGPSHSELPEVQQLFVGLRGELEPHMFKEERILFPAIRQLERAEQRPAFPFGTVANPIRVMIDEHDHAGDALARIREVTKDYAVPEDACNTYRAMLDALRQLESDMHVHVHKENSILFPRALEVEQTFAQSTRQ